MRREYEPARGVKIYSSVFETRIGWCGIIHNGKREVVRLYLPTTRKKALTHTKNLPGKKFPGAERKIRAYFDGKKTDFGGIECSLDGIPPFHKKIYKKLRKVPYGKTVTYGGLARAAGSPNASRAVGSAMAGNPIPLVIPCHRVIKANGDIGNFSADSGPALKVKMLEMEGRK